MPILQIWQDELTCFVLLP